MESTTWLQDLANNNELWNEIVMEQAPSVVAHEYHRLRDMGKQGQVFGFMLQLKDVMESILKFQVLLMAAFGETKEGAEEAYAFHFAERALSMGAWLALGGKIHKFCEKHACYPQILKNGWNAVRKAFNKFQWVAWRNAAIAHGALAFDADQYEDDIKDKLKELKALLDELVPCYLQLKVTDEHGAYIGYSSARDLEHENGDMLCHVGEETKLPLSNYILHRKHGIYFFDAITSGSMANCLSYPEGEHWQESITYWSKVDQLYRGGRIQGTTRLSTEDITNVLNEAVNRISLTGIHRFVRPDYLVDWLKQSLSQNDRGVFLLTMDRGCGKSAFTEKLNRLYANPLDLADDLDIRTYHISRTQTMQASQFTAAVANLWRKAYQDPNEKYKAVEFEEQTLMFIPKEDEIPAKALAAYLNTVREKTYDYRDRERILFVLDGLDEIIPDAEKLWDYIPSPELLDKGVYILLTGRNVDEQGLPVGYRQSIERLQINASLSVSAQTHANKQFLREYIKEQLSAGQCRYTDSIANKVIELSGGRVLYARMYVQLLASGKYRVEELADAENIIPAYLEQLKQRYGEKGWKQMVALLTVFATMYDVDSLTLEETSWLLGENGPTLQLLGMLSDISCLLNVERGYTVDGVTYAGENQYRLSGAQAAISLLDYLRNYEEVHFYAFTEGLVERVLHLVNYEVKVDSLGYLLFLSCIFQFIPKFCRKQWVIVEWHLITIANIIVDSANDGYNWKKSNYIDKSLLNLIYRLDNLKQLGIAINENSLAAIVYNRAVNLASMSSYDEALKEYDRCLAIQQPLHERGVSIGRHDLAKAYIGRGKVLAKMDDLERAVENCVCAIELLEVSEAKVMKKFADIGFAYEIIGECYQKRGFIASAMWNVDEAIRIYSDIEAKDNIEVKNRLATAHHARGMLQERNLQPLEALKDYSNSIDIGELLLKKNSLLDPNNLAASYNNRGSILKKLGRIEDAITDYNQCINIRIALQRIGALTPREDSLAIALINRGILFESIHKYKSALADYSQCITIREELLESQRLEISDPLANAYYIRGNLHETIWQRNNALMDYSRCVEIRERLQREGRLVEENVLAAAYNKRGYLLETMQRLDDALIDYNRCVEIRERLQREGRLADENDLAIAYDNRKSLLETMQ